MRSLLICSLCVSATAAAAGLGAHPGPAFVVRVSGRVVTAEASPKPLVRALVTLSAGNATAARSVLSDAAGAFQFTEVVPGNYSLTATKAGYLPGAFGATEPAGTGVSVTVVEAHDIANLAIEMTAAAVITGTIRDQRGNPMAGAPVSALRWSYRGTLFDRGVRALRPAPLNGATASDAKGAYRLFGLPPGDYVVAIPARLGSAGAQFQTTADDVERARAILAGRSDPHPVDAGRPSVAFPQTFHPGVAAVSRAVTIRLDAGAEVGGVDITVQPVVTAAVSGAVENSSGRAFQGTPRVTLRPADRSIEQGRGQQPSPRVRPTGEFDVSLLFPGTYVLNTRATLDGPAGSGPTHWGRLKIDVADRDISGIRLQLRPTVSVSGQLKTEAGACASSLADVSVSLFEAGEAIFYDIPAGKSAGDGSFVIRNVSPSRYQIAAPQVQGCVLQSIRLNGDTDYADTPLTIPEDGNLTGLEITYAKGLASLDGVLQDTTGRPATAYSLIVFSRESIYWTPQTRRVAAARPAMDGSFSFSNLPAGSYFLAAVTRVEEQQWFNPEFLASLTSAGVPVTIGDGARVTQNIRVRH